MKVKFILPICVALIASPVFAQSPDDSSVRNVTPVTETIAAKTSGDTLDWHQVGIGFSTAVGNLFYIPAKITYATLGGVAGGAAYIVMRGEHRAAHDIWRNSLRGDYVLTPSMIQGQEPIHFVDVEPESERLMANSALAPRNAGSARSTVPGKESSQGTLAKASNAEPRHAGSDSRQGFSGQNAPEPKPAKLDDQRGSLVRQSSWTSFSAQSLNQEKVPQFSIVPQ